MPIADPLYAFLFRGGLRGEERKIAISSGALFLFVRGFDGGMPGMRDGVLGLELVVNYSYSSSSQLSLDGSECKEKGLGLRQYPYFAYLCY